MAAVIGALRAEMSAGFARFAEDLGKASKSVGGFASNFEKQGEKLRGAGVVMSAAVTAPLVALATSAVPAATESAQAMSQVTSALNSMGGASGKTADELSKSAGELMRLSTFDDDEILRKVTANLLTFGNVAGKEFDRAQLAAVNLSARLGQDLQSSTVMVGKALNDPILGISALRRVGVQLTADQEKMIKSMVAVGDTAGAQSIILGELERQFGGAAKALRDATPGQDLKNSWDDFQETLGAFIVKILPPLTALLSGVLEAFNALPEPVQGGVVVVAALAAAVGPLLTAFGQLLIVMPALTTFMTATLIPALSAVGRVILGLLVSTGPIGWLILAVTAVVTVWMNWDKIGPIVGRMVNAVIGWLRDKLGPIFKWVGDRVKAVTQAFATMYDKVVGNSYVPDMVQRISEEFATLDGVMVRPAQDATSQVTDSFSNMADQVASGLTDMLMSGKFSLSSLRDLARSTADSLFIQPFKQQAQAGISGLIRSIGGSLFGGAPFGGGRAIGGPVTAGKSYMVNEGVRAERFVPMVDGQVQPGGGGTVVNQYISTPDADSFRKSRRQVAGDMKRAVNFG